MKDLKRCYACTSSGCGEYALMLLLLLGMKLVGSGLFVLLGSAGFLVV